MYYVLFKNVYLFMIEISQNDGYFKNNPVSEYINSDVIT